MLPIIDKISPVNPYSRPGIKLKHGVRGIVMHYTASPGAPAANIDAYFDRLAYSMDRYAGAHFSVDDITIIQSIPEQEMAYHCGSKTYTAEANERFKPYGRYPNNCTIGIEMCIDKSGNITEKTFKNCVDLVAYLIKKYGLTIKDIWTHKGIVGWKDCPLPWVKKPSEFERFKREVGKKLQPELQVPVKEEEEVDKCNVILNGKPLVGGILYQDHSYLPVKALAEALGVKVEWDGKTKTVKLTK